VNGTYDIEPLWKKMKIDVKSIVNHYKYDSDYEWLFFLLITHNAFIEYDPKQHYFIKYFAGLIPIKAYLNIEEDPIAVIFIKNNITKEDFKKWIDENWNDSDKACIGPSLKAIMPKIPLERGTYKNIAVDETIVELINKGKTNNQIYSSLCSTFSNNDFVYDYAWVNNRIARIKKRLHITTS